MYDPLIEIKHRDGSITKVRASNIFRVDDWKDGISIGDNKKVYFRLPDNTNTFVKSIINIPEIVNMINEIENRNEQTNLYTR